MIHITVDPSDPNRIILTATVTMYLDRLLSDALGNEVADAVREQARKDMKNNKIVKKAISDAAHRLLLGMLGCDVPAEPSAGQVPAEPSAGQVPAGAASGPPLAMGETTSPPAPAGKNEGGI